MPQCRMADPCAFALRMGFRYAKGLREETAQAIVRERDKHAFESIADLAHRVPEIRRNELVLLASIGALNSIGVNRERCARKSSNQCELGKNSACTGVMRCGRWSELHDLQVRCWTAFPT